MKISKLFHWLYALVMLLPIFALGSAILVNTFNQQAKEEVKINYRYETNEVNSFDDLIQGNAYHFKIENTSIDAVFNFSGIWGFNFNFFNIEKYNFNNYGINIDDTIPSSISNNEGYITIDLDCSNTLTYFNIFFNYNEINEYYTSLYTYSLDSDTFTLVGDFIYDGSYNITSFTDNAISKCTNIPIESVEQKEISNVFYDAVDNVEQSPLFSWAYDSFLVAPFSYIVALFGMPTNHVVVELLSYWLAISIIWLVFDLVMYVPLLVHRWLDKGVLE